MFKIHENHNVLTLSCRSTKSLTNSSLNDARLVVTVFHEDENALSGGKELTKHPSHFLDTIANNGNMDLLHFHQFIGDVL